MDECDNIHSQKNIVTSQLKQKTLEYWICIQFKYKQHRTHVLLIKLYETIDVVIYIYSKAKEYVSFILPMHVLYEECYWY